MQYREFPQTFYSLSRGCLSGMVWGLVSSDADCFSRLRFLQNFMFSFFVFIYFFSLPSFLHNFICLGIASRV